jgi:hypothetical protein
MDILNIKMWWIYRPKHVEHVLRTLPTYRYTINERGVKFRRLCVFFLFTQTLISQGHSTR